MNLKKCEKCGEDVEIVKAFCPGCGNPFVMEEKRAEVSEFDKYAGTLNFSNSVYNRLLSEMELDTSRPPEEEKKLNQVQPSTNNFSPQPEQNKNSGTLKWIIVAAVSSVILIFFVIIVLAAIYIYLY